MEIFILRHGEAEPGSDEEEEANRRLTPKGKRNVERVMRLASAAKIQPDLVLTSPYRRAKETAEIAIRHLDPKPPLKESAALLPGRSVNQVWKDIRSQEAQQPLLVGHEPQLSQLIAYLLACPALQFDFKKGAIVRVRMEELGREPHGELKWILTPGLANAARQSRL